MAIFRPSRRTKLPPRSHSLAGRRIRRAGLQRGYHTNGTAATTTFDAISRPTARTITRATGVLGPTGLTFTLDPVGRITGSATSGDTAAVTEVFAYDSLDRLLREEQKIGTGANRILTKAYDLAGNVTGLTYPSTLALTHVVDPLNRIAQVKQGATSIVTYRDTGARLFDKALGNGITQAWSYDPGRRLTQLLATKPGPTTVAQTTYTLSPLGNKREIARPDLGKKATYQFNPYSWITQEALNLPIAGGTPERQTDYTVDKVLNYSQIQERVSGTLTATKTQTINNRNQYTAFAGSSLTYDGNGNLTGGAIPNLGSGASLQYDYEDRLVKATKGDGTVVANLYDADGRKLRESVTVSGTTTTKDYVLNGAQVLEQYAGTTVSARYVHGRGIDETVRAELDTNADGTLETTLYPLQDEVANVERLTDAAGATLERYDYQGLGRLRIFDPAGGSRSASSYGWRWLFQGREYVPSLTAYDVRARTIWPELGRFGQEDPARPTPELSLYQALLGNWNRYTDPTGLYEVDVHHYLTTYLAGHAGFPASGFIAGGLTQSDQSAGGLADEIGLHTQELDMDKERVAGFAKWTNAYYHFVPLSVLERRFAGVDLLAKLAPDDLQTWVRTGEYLHGLQDSYSHQRDPLRRDPSQAYGTTWGHAEDRHWADWTFERPALAVAMASETYDRLRALAESSRQNPATDWSKIVSDVKMFAEHTPTEFFLEPLSLRTLAVRDYTTKIKLLDRNFQLTKRERDRVASELRWTGTKLMPYQPSHWRQQGGW